MTASYMWADNTCDKVDARLCFDKIDSIQE